MVKLAGFLFPLIKFPGLPSTTLPGVHQKIHQTIEKPVPGRELFHGDEIDYMKPKLNTFEFLCFPLTRDSPGVIDIYDVDFCLPYFPEEDISAKTQVIVERIVERIVD